MGSAESDRLARWRTVAYAVWAVIGVLALFAVTVLFLGRIRSALVPFVIAFLIVFVLNWPVNALARRGLSRGIATLVCFFIGLLVLVVLGFALAPPLAMQLRQFSASLPHYMQQSDVVFRTLQARLAGFSVPSWLNNIVQQESSEFGASASRLGAESADLALAAGSGVARGAIDFLIAVVVSFWILRDMPTISEEIRSLISPRFHADYDNLFQTLARVVGGYLRGQTIAALVVGASEALLLTILGVPYALVVGIVGFFFDFVPYVGPVLTGVLAGLLAFFGHGRFSPQVDALLAIAVVVLVQNVTDTVVLPRVMSARVNLHPSLVIFVILVGASLFGIAGMLLAIPVAATANGLFVYYWERRSGQPLASEDGALFRGLGSAESPAGTDDDEFVEEI